MYSGSTDNWDVTDHDGDGDLEAEASSGGHTDPLIIRDRAELCVTGDRTISVNYTSDTSNWKRNAFILFEDGGRGFWEVKVAVQGDAIIIKDPSGDQVLKKSLNTPSSARFAVEVTQNTTAGTSTIEVRLDDQTVAQHTVNREIDGGTIGFGSRTGSLSIRTWFDDLTVEATPFRELQPSQLTEGNTFGVDLVQDRDRLVVGAPASWNSSDPGSTYVFANGPDWVLDERLHESSLSGSSNFGESVEIPDDLIFVGASKSSNGGKVFVYRQENGSWKHVETLDESSERFGRSLSYDNEKLAVGAPHEDTCERECGAVYIYNRSGGSWVRETKIVDHASGDCNHDYQGSSCSVHRFGTRVAIAGDRLVATAIGGVGEAHLFERINGTWTEVDQVEGQTLDDHFNGSTVFVGAHRGETDAGTDAGYVFTGQWGQTPQIVNDPLTAPDGDAEDRFGSIGQYGDRLVVGASGDDTSASDTGSAYVFGWNGSGWEFEAKITPDSLKAGDRFGRSISLGVSDFAIGAMGRDQGDEEHVGSVFVLPNI